MFDQDGNKSASRYLSHGKGGDNLRREKGYSKFIYSETITALQTNYCSTRNKPYL